MSDFSTFLQLGFGHISDIKAYDHILFLIALCAGYRVAQWQMVLILVTAFTIGHSLTLALATIGVILVPNHIIEFLIPVTILVTAVLNVVENKHGTMPTRMRLNYGLALFFGLIHGLGFSNYLRMLLGLEETIVLPLLAFNLGLEIGQVLIVALIFLAGFLAMNLLRLKHRYWTVTVSAVAGVIAIFLMYQTKPW